MYGQVIGVNTFGWEGGGAQNINFAISSLDIAEVLKKKSNTVTTISPQSVPRKIGDEFTSAQDLVGTERGRVLLSQIREAVILAVPLSEDPTGRMMDFVTVTAERTVTTKLRWKKVRRASELHGSTAIVVMVAYLRLSDDFDSNSATELVLHTRIICRDVDRDGHELLALVWDDREAVGQVTANALAQGIISRQMQDAVTRYFNKLPLEYRNAIHELEN